MFWPTLTHYGWAVSIRTAGQFVALQVDSFHHNGWRYWVRIRNTFLKREFQRIGLDFRAQTLCTVKLSRKFFPQYHRHSLDSLIDRHEISVSDRHRALTDARILSMLWEKWLGLVSHDIFYGSVRELVGKPALPPQIDPGIIDDLPESPGAYALYGQSGECLLVRRSANLRRQILAHFSASQKDTALLRNTHRIDWREAAGELGARLHEMVISDQGRKTNDELCAWQLLPDQNHGFKTRLVYARDVDFSSTPDLFGPYLSPREAIHALRKIANAHRLCQKILGLDTNFSDKACIGYRQKSCRGVCVGKESHSMHHARVLAALARSSLHCWPFPGPVAFVERDEYGTREDYHVISRWRYLGTTQSEEKLRQLIEERSNADLEFDPEIYRLVAKFSKSSKIRIIQLAFSD